MTLRGRNALHDPDPLASLIMREFRATPHEVERYVR